MIDKGQRREFGQDTGVTPLLFYDECHGICSDHRESGPRWVCSGALPLTHNFFPRSFLIQRRSGRRTTFPRH